ncbi:MAG: element excision factor XisI family protein [Thiolinea sp.]
MATELDYVALIKKILLEYAQYKPAYGDIETSVSFDDEHANYVLLQAGWDRDDYLHGAIVHVRLIDGKNLDLNMTERCKAASGAD